MPEPDRAPLVSGLLLGILVAGILVTSPATFVGRGATFIDTEAWASKGGGVSVETRAYLRSTDEMHAFPATFDEWNMTADISDRWEQVRETFRADVVVSRYYTSEGVFLPLHLFIVDSKYTRVLHSLPVSYGLQGLEPAGRGEMMLDVKNDTWLDEGSSNTQVPIVEMTFVKRNSTTGSVEERRLVHFFWVKREAWGVTNHLTWIGTSMPVPPTGDLAPHQRLLANFTGSVVAAAFTPESSDVANTVAAALVDDRPTGPIVLVGAIGVPVVLIGYGFVTLRRRPA